MKTLSFAILLAIIVAGPASAAATCEAVALRDIGALEDSRSILAKGEVRDNIAEYQVDRSGEGALCSYRGLCYPTHVEVSGRKMEALRLTNCRPDMKKGRTDDDYTSYPVEMARSKVPAAQLRHEDLEKRFLSMGMCRACAGGAANLYLQRTKSRCAKLAKSALEGNLEAAAKLGESPDFCMLTSGANGETVWPR